MIKVIARNTNQAVEIAEAFKNSDASIVIEVKENTTAENSDVDDVSFIKQATLIHNDLLISLLKLFMDLAEQEKNN